MKSREEGNFLTCAVIFPNTRPKSYFKEALIAQYEGDALVLPALFSMDEWMAKLSPFAPVSEIEARLMLYRSFKAIKNPDEELDQFWTLSQALFQDHETLVRNLAPIDKIFHHVKYWEETGAAFADFLTEDQKNTLQHFWSYFEGENLSLSRRRFIELWTALPAVYHHFQQSLISQNRATSAMMYAQSLSKPADNPWVKSFDDLYFVGFGALSKAEQALIAELKRLNKAHLEWDLENWYMHNPQHEVARLFSPYRQSDVFSASIEATLSKQNSEKPSSKFQIISCQGAAGMGLQLAEIAKKSGPETAVILTDPTLVSALLLHETEQSEAYNITLGFPLEATPPCLWIQKLLRWKMKSKKRQPIDLDQWLQDPFTTLYFPSLSENLVEPSKSPSDVEWMKKLPNWMKEADVLPFLKGLNHWWEENYKISLESPFEKNLANTIQELLQKLISWAERYELATIGFPALSALWQALIRSERLAIKGSKEKGVQVLGLYESRLLDFEHVVVAPAEQGKLCGSGEDPSFLTESIRRTFGLPLVATQIEDQVYQFYRLTHRAKTITLLIDNKLEFKEDRIVQQVRFSPEFEVEEISQISKGSQPFVKAIMLPKDAAYFAVLDKFFRPAPEGSRKRALSPNSLHALLTCPLKFYYQYVLGLQKPKEANHLEMHPMDFGNWVHTIVQDLYAETAEKDKPLTTADYEKMISKIALKKEAIWDNLNGKISPGTLAEYRVEEKMGPLMVEKFFRFMANEVPHKWLHNELNLKPLGFKKGDLEWQISGRCDLVFETESEFWLIDLKTGGTESTHIKGWDSEKTENKLITDKDLLQMALYDMVANQNGDFTGKKAKVFLFRLSHPEAKLHAPMEYADTGQLHEGLQSWISKNIELMMDPALAIRQTDDFKRCMNCDFKEICRR